MRKFKYTFCSIGCYCTCCKASVKEGNNLKFIEKRFPMNRSPQELNSDYERLAKAGVFKRKTLPSNYKIRYGLTQKPMFKRLDATKVSLFSITNLFVMNIPLFHSLQITPPLHFLLCCLNSKENFAYHLNAREDPDDIPRMKPYLRKTKKQMDAVKEAKQDFINRAKTHLGQLFDSPISSGTSGNSGKSLSK